MRGIERKDNVEANIRVDTVGEQMTAKASQGIVSLSFRECAADTPSPFLHRHTTARFALH